MSRWSKYITPTQPSRWAKYATNTTAIEQPQFEMEQEAPTDLVTAVQQYPTPTIHPRIAPGAFPEVPIWATRTTTPLAPGFGGVEGIPTVEVVPAKEDIRVLGESLTKLPQQIGASVLQAVQGEGGASVVNKDWADRYIQSANEDINRFVEEVSLQYPGSRFLKEAAQLSQNVAYSLTAMGAGTLAALPLWLAPEPTAGTKVAASAITGAVSGYVSYRMTTYQITQLYLEFKNNEKVVQTGQGLTADEEMQLKADFHDKAVKYGLWEAIPEGISNMLFSGILTGAFTNTLVKVAGQNAARSILNSLGFKITSQIVGIYGEELLTETITQKGQAAIEAEAGLREGTISWWEAFQEIAPQTFMLTTLMAGAGQTIISTKSAISKIRTSLKNEIGEDSAGYTIISDRLETELSTAMADWDTVTGQTTTEVEFNPIETPVGKGFEILQYGDKVGEVSYSTEVPGVEGIVLDRIDIIPEAQRQGLATQAIDRVLSEAEAANVPLYTGLMEADGVKLFNALEERGVISLTPSGQRMLGDVVTRGVPEYTSTRAMAEGETVSIDLATGEAVIPETLPTTPPPITPEGNILGQSDNDYNGVMKDLQDAGEVGDVIFRNDYIRKWVKNTPLLKGLSRLLNPQTTANTPAERAIAIMNELYFEGTQKTQGVIASLTQLGTREKIFGKIDKRGVFTKGILKGETLGDIAQQRSKWNSRLTELQKLWLDRAAIIENSCIDLLKENGIEVKKLTLEEGGQFATRRVWARKLKDGTVVEIAYIGAGPGRIGAKISTEKHRIFKTEAEAIKEGYMYVPYEEALYLKVLGAYKRVAQKKVSDWFFSRITWRTNGAPEELILAAEQANRKKRHSQMLLAALNRAVRGERITDATINAIAEHYPEQAQRLKALIPDLQAAKPVAKEVQDLTNVAKGLVETDTMMVYRAVNKRARAREQAMQVGITEAMIPHPAFSGKILTGTDAREIAETFRKSFDPSFNKFLNAVNKVNAIARFYMLAGDVSPYQIQLIFLMGQPVIFSKVVAGSIRALFNPDFHANQIAHFKDLIDKHRYLQLSIQGTEFTELMHRGGWLGGEINFRPEGERYLKSMTLFAPRAAAKVAQTALTPFQRLFEAALDLAGLYMADAYDYLCTTPEATADVDLFINDFRGLYSSARVGINQNQRMGENAAVLASQYNRAIGGLILDLMRGNIRGSLARKSLMKGITALSFMAIAISLLRGEPPDEIIEHFNPNSSKFFTWDIAGQKIGPGSKVRSLMKLIAQSASNPDELLEFSMDNPAIRFIRANLSPVASTGVDILTGRDYIGDPTRDGLLTFSEKVIAENLLPIWVQTSLFEGGNLGGRSVRGLAEFMGWRSYPEPLWDEVSKLRDKYAQQDFRLGWEDLNREQIDKVEANHPDLKDLTERAKLEGAERGNEVDVAIYQITQNAIEQRDTSLETVATQLLNGGISKYEYDNERGYIRPYYSGAMSAIWQFRESLTPDDIEDIDKWLAENQKPEDKALDAYQEYRASLIEKSELPRDWDDIEAKCAIFLARYPKNIQDYVLRNLNRWINDLPENAKQVELIRLQGIENETWWDNYRGVTGGASRWAGYMGGGQVSSGSRWSKYVR